MTSQRNELDTLDLNHAAFSFNIQPFDPGNTEYIQAVIDNKTKPLGALGELETLALQLIHIQLGNTSINPEFISSFKPNISHPQLIVFAGDHGVAAEGVSIAPSEVTSQMVANFANGGAAINVFCQQVNMNLTVVDAGILTEHVAGNVLNQRLGSITQPIHKSAALSEKQLIQGFTYATKLVQQKKAQGCNVIAFGEMGIGNTTSAAAIMSALMNKPAEFAVGKGTGVSPDIVKRKQHIVQQALDLHQQHLHNPLTLLMCLGGFEIVQITAAMLAAAEQKMAVIVDGFICTAAAMVAVKINPAVKNYMIFAHCSGEQGHEKMLQWLNVKPLLNLGLRLGEGTGAALALPMLEAAVGFYNNMASFEQAEVTNVV